jgi:tetratricopeptide (TPR) repeat protein
MNGRWIRWFGLGLVWLLAPAMLPADEPPALTAAEQQLLQEAAKLQAEGVALYGQTKLAAATERLRKALELYQRVYPREKYPDGHPDLALSLNNLGAVLQAQAENGRAEPFLRQALAMRQTLYPKARYPDGHPDLAHSLRNLGFVLQAQAEYSQAEPFFRQALAMTQALYPTDKYPDGHPDLANSLNRLGSLLKVEGAYGQAEPLYRQALAMRQKLYPTDKYPNGHPDLALSLNNLGAVLEAHGAYDKAEPFFRQALAMNQALYPQAQYPDGHPQLAQSLDNLGALLRDQGKFGQAEPLYRQALEMRQALYPRTRYPDGHPELASSLNNLGFALWAQGVYGQAEPFLRQALAIRQALYPRARYPHSHPELEQSLTNLGAVLQAQGDYGQAEPLYRQALAMNQALYPKDKYPDGHPDLAHCLHNLGGLLQAQGEYGQAESFFRQALAMKQALYPKDKYPDGHPHLAISLTHLGLLLKAQGEYGQARPCLRQAVAMYEALYPKAQYPDGHPDLAGSFYNLGVLLEAQGEYGQAETFSRRALEMNQALYPKAQYPDGHPDVAHCLNNLGYVFQAQGEYGQAETFLRQALAMKQALYPKPQYPDGHADLALSLHNLGALLRMQGEYSQAEAFVREALAMYTGQATRLAQVAPEPVALNAAATFPLSRDALLSVTRTLPDAAARTYEGVWHAKASITRVYQRRHLALIAAATDATVRRDWDRLQSLRRQRQHLLLVPAPLDRATRQKQIDRLDQDIGEIQQALQPRLPVLPYCEELAKLGPNALQQRLAADTVLVDLLRYTLFEQDSNHPGEKGEKRTVRYLAFVLSRAAIQRVELGTAAELDAAVQEWRQAITLRLPAGNDAARRDRDARLRRHGQRLRDLIWEPVEKHFPAGIRTVFVAPDGELTQLPWGALPGGDLDRVLLDDYALAVLPHGPFLLEQLTTPPARSAQRPPPPQDLLVVGGIRYDDQPTASVTTKRAAEGVVAQPVNWGYLPGTEAERCLLENLLAKTGPKRAVSLGGAEAATARLRQELEQARYAHLATHGFFADKQFHSILQLDPKLFDRRMDLEGHIMERRGEGARSPLVLSGLVCAGANRPDTPERGILSGDAIAGLLLDDLELAVLSACDTGLGDVAGGEGVFGLQRAFHIAGCHNVVASLWKVDDAATAALMTRFYSYLFAPEEAQRLPPLEALRRAQLDLYRHPELIPAWSRGEARAPGLPRPATTPPPADTPPELVTSAGRAPIKLWAAFGLSGLGR